MYDLSRELAELLEEDNRYRVGAYEFVFNALAFAQTVLRMGTESPSEPAGPAEENEEKSEEPEEPQQHVSGQELCEAIRRYALRQYGYMAKTVLNNWGIQCTGDIGEIVFNLIRFGRMRRTKHDRREDFEDVFDFETAFEQEFKITPPE
ncbi:MAG: Minf_1886 family protein [Planctomycetota bacterium]